MLIVVAALAIYGIWKRHHNDEVLADTTQEMAAPSVIALPPKAGAPIDNFVLPGNVSAFTDAPIYARTSGYLTKWYYDIGARVKKGALLAEISHAGIRPTVGCRPRRSWRLRRQPQAMRRPSQSATKTW